jgi:hypothetical protein
MFSFNEDGGKRVRPRRRVNASSCTSWEASELKQECGGNTTAGAQLKLKFGVGTLKNLKRVKNWLKGLNVQDGERFFLIWRGFGSIYSTQGDEISERSMHGSEVGELSFRGHCVGAPGPGRSTSSRMPSSIDRWFRLQQAISTGHATWLGCQWQAACILRPKWSKRSKLKIKLTWN